MIANHRNKLTKELNCNCQHITYLEGSQSCVDCLTIMLILSSSDMLSLLTGSITGFTSFVCNVPAMAYQLGPIPTGTECYNAGPSLFVLAIYLVINLQHWDNRDSGNFYDVSSIQQQDRRIQATGSKPCPERSLQCKAQSRGLKWKWMDKKYPVIFPVVRLKLPQDTRRPVTRVKKKKNTF